MKAKAPSGSKTGLTRPGLILAMILFAMVMAAMNYSNNMGYILSFLLISLMLVGFLHTRNNLKGLEVIQVRTQPVFAGERIFFTADLANRSRKRRVAFYAAPFGARSAEDFSGPFSVSPDSNVTVRVSLDTESRGRYPLTGLILYTVYPLGLFQARCHVLTRMLYIVYPQPSGTRQWPAAEEHDSDTSEGFYTRGGDDFVGLRPYRPGESMHHVDWKAVARGRPLAIKEFTGGGSEQMWFDWNQLTGLETESRISQLTRWVLEADQEGREFGLRLPGEQVELDSSPGHTVKCLEHLATFGQENVRHDEL